VIQIALWFSRGHGFRPEEHPDSLSSRTKPEKPPGVARSCGHWSLKVRQCDAPSSLDLRKASQRVTCCGTQITVETRSAVAGVLRPRSVSRWPGTTLVHFRGTRDTARSMGRYLAACVKGLAHGHPIALKSVSFHVATVAPVRMAMAASNPSTTLGAPLLWRRASPVMRAAASQS
jgi:hypothetical protein